MVVYAGTDSLIRYPKHNTLTQRVDRKRRARFTQRTIIIIFIDKNKYSTPQRVRVVTKYFENNN